ncbi:hypothetical protein AB0D02_06775, partial [Streptomyces pseudogriseolus]
VLRGAGLSARVVVCEELYATVVIGTAGTRDPVTPPLPRSRERGQRKLVTCLLTGRHGNSPAAHGR